MIRHRLSLPVGVVICLLMFVSCLSRYRLDLYMLSGEERTKVKIEQTEYVTGARIRDPYADEKLIVGDGNCVILHTGARGQRLETDMTETLMLQYDEYVRCLVYLELPAEPRADSLSLDGRGFVQILGRYDQPAERKIYTAHSGTLVVDSIVDDRLYAAIEGDFRNTNGESVGYTGRFRVKIAD